MLELGSLRFSKGQVKVTFARLFQLLNSVTLAMQYLKGLVKMFTLLDNVTLNPLFMSLVKVTFMPP